MLCQGIVLKYQTIQRSHDKFPILIICRLLHVSRSGYYNWAARPASSRQIDHERLLCRIRQIHADSQGGLGTPRMHIDLVEDGETASEKRIACLTAGDGLHGWPRKKKRRQRGKPGLPVPEVKNLLERNFNALEPETKRVSHITVVQTGEGELYLCVVVGLLSKLVPGSSMHHRQDRQMEFEQWI